MNIHCFLYGHEYVFLVKGVYEHDGRQWRKIYKIHGVCKKCGKRQVR